MPVVTRSYPSIDEALPVLSEALLHARTAIFVAPPGEGKTTRTPLHLLQAPWLEGQRIVMLEPRRLAAVNAASYMARLVGEEVGEQVGYTIRYRRRVSPRTRIEVVTEGVLARRLQHDPELKGVGLVVFDEFHERSIDSDLALALCRDAQQGLREDLRLLVMSATLAAEPLSRHLGDCPLITVTGRRYPVEIRHVVPPENADLAQVVERGVRTALSHTDGDLLVFLPGAREIRGCQERLSDLVHLDVRALFGDLSFDRQQQAILPGGRRRIVLATNIAETSLTIEGVSAVVDSGYERRPRFNPGSGLTTLETVRISRQSAEQRAGRAGRLGPGLCWRLWGEGVHGGLLPVTPPEITTSDLAGVALELAGWGVREPREMTWLDEPPGGAFLAARRLLSQLGALDAQGGLTRVGREMVALPAHPRLARLLVAARELDLLATGCWLVAMLDEGAVLRTLGRQDDLAEAFSVLVGVTDSAERFPRTWRAARYWLDRFRMSRHAPCVSDSHVLGRLLTFAYPDRVAVQREVQGEGYLLSSGRGCRLASGSSLRTQALLVAVEVAETGAAEGTVRHACSVDSGLLRQDLSHLITRRRTLEYDVRRQRIEGWELTAILDAPLERRRRDPDKEELGRGLCEAVRKLGLEVLGWSRASRQLLARLQMVSRLFPGEWPEVSTHHLLDTLEEWLLPCIPGVRDVKGLQAFDPGVALKLLLDGGQRGKLERLAPERLEVPSGSQVLLDYTPGEAPVLAVKLQEMFGCVETPRVAGGRQPVLIHLLSPAGRPVQVTSDLGHFWREIYPEVRRELRGRYAKHPWPDDPLTAAATRHTRRRSG